MQKNESMKRIILFALLLTPFIQLRAQDKAVIPDSLKIWKRGGSFTMNFTQASYSNWAAGGINSISGQALFSTYINYKKGLTTWENTLDMAYGLMQQSTSALVKKTDDKFDFSSKYGHTAFSSKWNYSALFGFKTQFQPGYNYINDTLATKISDLMSPGYMLLAIGLDYKPNTKFSLLMSPLTGRITFVEDQVLANAGAFGVKPAEYDALGNLTKLGERTRYEFGSYIRAQYKADVMKNVSLGARLEFFSNYLKNPQNIDVNADFLVTMKVNKFISASLNLSGIYDDDIQIAVDNNHDGVIDGKGPRFQFRQVIGIGFTAQF